MFCDTWVMRAEQFRGRNVACGAEGAGLWASQPEASAQESQAQCGLEVPLSEGKTRAWPINLSRSKPDTSRGRRPFLVFSGSLDGRERG